MGNIQALTQLESSTRSFSGHSIGCPMAMPAMMHLAGVSVRDCTKSATASSRVLPQVTMFLKHRHPVHQVGLPTVIGLEDLGPVHPALLAVGLYRRNQDFEANMVKVVLLERDMQDTLERPEVRASCIFNLERLTR